MKLSVGDKVWFEEEKQGYTVQASDELFAVCTKPFNAKKTVLYTIIDFKKEIRGTENLVFCMGFESKTECKDALIRLQKGESEVSHRKNIPLKIRKIKYANKLKNLVNSSHKEVDDAVS